MERPRCAALHRKDAAGNDLAIGTATLLSVLAYGSLAQAMASADDPAWGIAP